MKKLLACLLLMALLCLPCAGAEQYPPDEYVWTKENGLYGLSDAEGQVILPCEYGQEPIVLEEIGCIYVLRDGLWGLLDLQGNAVIAPEWDALYSLDEGRTLWAAFRGEMVMNIRGWDEPGEGLWALYAADGTERSPLQWAEIGKLTDGLMIVEKDGLKGAINARGEIVIPVEYSWSHGPYFGRLAVEKDGRYAVLDMTGVEVIPLTECSGMHLYYDETVRVRQGTDVHAREGVCDLTGREITPCIWLSVSGFCEGMAAVDDGDACGYIDWQGNVVIPCQWQYAGDFTGGYAIVQQDGLYGVIDTTGTLVVPCEWDTLEWREDGQLLGTKETVFSVDD